MKFFFLVILAVSMAHEVSSQDYGPDVSGVYYLNSDDNKDIVCVVGWDGIAKIQKEDIVVDGKSEDLICVSLSPDVQLQITGEAVIGKTIMLVRHGIVLLEAKSMDWPPDRQEFELCFFVSKGLSDALKQVLNE